MSTPRAYKPQIGSIPHRVITFLVNNPDEELSSNDIAEKYDTESGGVCAAMNKARQVGAVALSDGTWKIGDLSVARATIGRDDPTRKSSALIAQHIASATAPVPDGSTSTRVTLPGGYVAQIEEVDYAPPRRVGQGGMLDGLFDALAASEPRNGKTCRAALPAHIKTQQITGAIQRWHRKHGHKTAVIEFTRTNAGAPAVQLAIAGGNRHG